MDPGLPINETRRPKADKNTHVLDAEGMYLYLALLICMPYWWYRQGTTPEYVYKLWLAHGITTIREPGLFLGWIGTFDIAN